MPPKAKPALGAKKPTVDENKVGHSLTMQKNAATEVVVKVNQKQSLNIVKTSVAASLSTILFIKNIFPEYYFEHRSYRFKSADFSYEVTPADARALKRQKEDNTTVSWDMLVPGKHKQVDKLLYWLDGIGEAIKLQYLASFVISIHQGRISPDTLKEAYVLNFAYKGPGQQPQIGFTIGNETVDITLQTQQDMKTLFHRLLTVANNHGVDLPENPAIGMQLTYNDTCPREYEPPGFRAAPPSKCIEEAAPTVIGEMTTGYHTLEMRMLRPPNLPAVAAMPPKTQNALDAELNLDSSLQISTGKAVRMAPLPPKMPRNPGPSLNLDSSPSKSQYTESTMGTPLKGPRGQVHHMIRHNQAEIFDTQLAGGANHEMQDTAQRNEERSATARERHLVQSGRAIGEPSGRLVSFEKTAGLDIEALVSKVSLSPTDADSNCVCGKNKEGQVHGCQTCGALQHRKCYGLVDSDILKTFTCYSCLLKADQPLLRQMKGICQLRRLLAIIASEGYPITESELAKPTGYLVKDVKAASARLAEEGYLHKVFRPGQNKAKAFRKGPPLPPYEFDETQRERLLKEYWNPAYKVEAFVHTITQLEILNVMKQPKDKMNTTVIPPTPPSSKPQPPTKPLVSKSGPSKPAMMCMNMDDDNDDEDDDLSSSRREGDFSEAKGSSSRTGSPVRLQPMAKKRKGEDLGDQGPGKKALKTSTPKSPFPLSSP